MALAGLLTSTPLEDRGGPIGANRFDFQVDWAFAQMLELMRSNADFVIVLDFHDDVLILDSESKPAFVDIYQIKSKDTGYWSIANLVKRAVGENGARLSIVGKLYRHCIKWKPHVRSVSFVSNVGLKSQTAKGAPTIHMTTVVFDTLHKDERGRISQAITKEHGATVGKAADLSRIAFRKTVLACAGHSNECLGMLAEYLDQDPTTRRIPSAAFYRTVKQVLRGLSHSESVPSNLAELIADKSITRRSFQHMLEAAAREPAQGDFGASVAARLNAEQAPFREVQQISSHLVTLAIRRNDPTQALLHKDLETIRTAVSGTSIRNTLWDTIEDVRTALTTRHSTVAQRLGIGMSRAMIAMVLHE